MLRLLVYALLFWLLFRLIRGGRRPDPKVGGQARQPFQRAEPADFEVLDEDEKKHS